MAIPLTFFSLLVVTGPPSSEPTFDGCGEHDGLVIAAESDVSFGSQRRNLVNDWNNSHGPELRATMVEAGSSIDLLHSQVATAAQTHSCSYDVLVLDTPWTAEFAERGAIERVKPEWMEDPEGFIDQVLDTGRWRDDQYAVPWTTDAGLLYSRAGTTTPNSWTDLVRAGYATQLADYEGLTVNALEVVWNFTKKPTILSGPVEKIDKSTAQLILNALTVFAGSGRYVTASRQWFEADTIEAFAGRTEDRPTLMRNWPYAFRVLTADPRIGGAFTVKELPDPGFTVLGGQNLAVSAYSKHKEDAGQLIKYLTRPQAEEWLFACGGYPPTRLDALRTRCTRPDQSGSTNDPDVPTQQRLAQLATSLRAALTGARPRPATPYYGQFSETFRGCVNKVFTHQQPDADKLARVLNDVLEGRQSSC
jgi:multiple sugar transport system substrate-binding protein